MAQQSCNSSEHKNPHKCERFTRCVVGVPTDNHDDDGKDVDDGDDDGKSRCLRDTRVCVGREGDKHTLGGRLRSANGAQCKDVVAECVCVCMFLRGV